MADEHPVTPAAPYGEQVGWQPATPRLRPLRLLVSWIVAAASIWVAAALVPGVGLEQTGAAFVVAALIAVLNALLPPVLAALRLPFMLIAGFLLVLLADALLLLIAHELVPDDIHVGGFGDALLAALVMAAVSVVLQAILGTNDDDEYSLKVTRRIAKRQGAQERSDVPGIIFLE
ncbi:MAG TPA: phage holin family protein, partial [Solirubrobacteraceae bacterium]